MIRASLKIIKWFVGQPKLFEIEIGIQVYVLTI